MNLYIRAKIGFCNCTTGVADDEELDRISDFALSERLAALAAGAADYGGLDERAQPSFTITARGVQQRRLSVGFNDRCDAIVATAVPEKQATSRAGGARLPQQSHGAALGRGGARALTARSTASVKLTDISQKLVAVLAEPLPVLLQASEDGHVLTEELAAHFTRVAAASLVATFADVVLREGRRDAADHDGECEGRG